MTWLALLRKAVASVMEEDIRNLVIATMQHASRGGEACKHYKLTSNTSVLVRITPNTN